MTLQVTEEGILVVGGEEATDEIRETIISLSQISGISVKEACERINLAINTFSECWQTLENALKALAEVFQQVEEIANPVQAGGHGTAAVVEQKKPREAILSIKWSERYRPP